MDSQSCRRSTSPYSFEKRSPTPPLPSPGLDLNAALLAKEEQQAALQQQVALQQHAALQQQAALQPQAALQHLAQYYTIEEINTKEIAQRISHELKRYSIPQSIFAQRVLCRSPGTLRDLLSKPKPWWKLRSGRETFKRMWAWLQMPEFQRISALKLAGISKRKKLAPELKVHLNVCEDNFDQCYKDTKDLQARFVKTAIPRHYKGKESNDIESEDESNEIECKKESKDIESEDESNEIVCKKESYDIESEDESNEIQHDKESNDIQTEDESNEIECEKESNDIDGVNDENKSDSVDPTQAIEDDNVVEILCMECDKPIKESEFQWWCLQCGGLRCGHCALRMVHRPHFLLRSPANTTPEQIKILVTAIQKDLQLEEFFNTRDADKHVDNVESAESVFLPRVIPPFCHASWEPGNRSAMNPKSADVDLDVIEESLQEPIVKAEPPEDEEDPLAECSNSSILKPDGTPTNNYYSKDRQPNSQNCRPNHKHGLHDSFNTHDENSDLPLRGDMVFGLRDTDYQPSEKSLGLVNPFEFQRNLQYLGLDKPLENQASQSLGLADSIDYIPSKKSVCLNVSPDYQVSQAAGSSLDSQDWIDYQPSKKSVCHESIDRASQTSKSLGNSEHRPKCLDFDNLYCNFGLFKYNQPDIADIRHSASLQAAPKGPDRAPSPEPTSIELSGPCTLATDKVPNIDPTSMESSGSCSFATDVFPDTDPTGVELSGYEFDGSSVQLETLDQRDDDFRPPCKKRVRIQPNTENVENYLVNTITAQATEIKNTYQQPAQVTLSEDEIEYRKNKEPTPQPLRRVYFNYKKTDYIKTQQPEVQTHSTHKKQSCTVAISDNKSDHNKQDSVNTLGKLKNTSNIKQKSQIHATYTKQGFKKTAVQKGHNEQKTVDNPNNDPLKTQLPEIPPDSTHKDQNSTDTSEEQNNKSETQQPPIKVYSKKRSCTNIIVQKENKLKSINTIGDPEKDPNKTQEPEIKIYTTHKKQNCKNITEPEDDNSTTQEPKMLVYSTHKKRNCTDSTEHRNNPKTHISIEMNLTHKDMKPTETTEQNRDSNKIQETNIQVYSTHKARNSQHS
ncbi:uncharacterized protein LOC134801552 isoform X2 [Cydia splendana]|uniref:uncharacterized protein LOC134801552 isoform X2 n=1 Tax=Cydia splendana TaxID=1100963 RepID=UPI00213187EC